MMLPCLLAFLRVLTTTLKCLNVRRGKPKGRKKEKKTGEGCCVFSAYLCLPVYVLNEELGGGVGLAYKSQYF